jgi:O-antigen/teichoic acid export membrane protein
MQKTFLSNLILIVVLNLLIKPFYILGIDAEVQNRVGAEIYGNYFALLNFSFLLNILLDFGISNYNNRNIAQNPQLVNSYFGKLLSIRFLLFFLYFIFTLSAGISIGYSSSEIYFLSLLVLNQFLVATIQFARSNFGGLHLFKIDSIISVLDRVLMIVLCGFLLWSPVVKTNFKIEWFIYAQTFSYLFTAIISIVLLKYKIGTVKLKLKKVFSIALLKESFPYALLILLMTFYNRIDSVMIERMLEDGDRQAGIYAQGFRYLDAVNMFALLFAGLLFPIFARLFKNKESIQPILELGVKTLLPISIIIGTTAYFYKFDLMALRYTSNLLEASDSFGYLIISFIPVSFTYIFGTLLTANGSLKQLNIMAIGGVFLNVILNYILIPELKAEGAAIATLITQISTALVQVILALIIFKLKVNIKLILKFLGLIIGIVCIQSIFKGDLLVLSNLTKLFSVLTLSTVFAFIIGLLPFKSLIYIFKNSK